MNCPRCQQDNPPHAKFCLECGAPFKRAHASGQPPPSYTDLQHALTEAFEEQTATSEILRVISQSPSDVQPVFDAIADSAARLCAADDAEIYVVDGDLYRRVAHRGPVPIAGPVGEAYPITRGRPSSRAIIDRQTIHVHDQAAEIDTEFPDLRAWQQVAGVRTILATPLLRDGAAIGVIGIRRTEVKPFTDRHIALLQTFADQAVIAIENVRLFQELQSRNRDLSEALGQQTATSEILRVISSSPTDLQPVFDAIAESAVRLCSGLYSSVVRYDGEILRLVATNHTTTEALEARRRVYPRRLGTRDSLVDRAIAEGRIVHIPDVETDATVSAWSRAQGRALGYRSFLATPMFREGRALGVVMVSRTEPIPFSDKQMELLQTFADQAVIAIENVRLFTELEARNRDLTESLEQRTATAEILRVISSSPTDVQPVFDTILDSATRLCEAQRGALFLYDGEAYHAAAFQGAEPALVEHHKHAPIRPGPHTALARVVRELRPVHIEDVLADAAFAEGDPLRRAVVELEGMRTLLMVPLLKEGQVVGALAVHRREVRPFTDGQIALMQTFATQAVIAIENVRLFQELRARNAELTESLQQQTATAEILRVIASSPTDLQPVMDAVAESAARLCEATDSAIFRVGGEGLRLVALRGPMALAVAIGDAIPISHGSTLGRAFVDRRTIHVPDMAAESDLEFPESKARALRTGVRSQLATPLLRQGVPIGVIEIRRTEVRPFTGTQIKLLETFADQAVIAIENVRLFTELQEKNRALTRAHAQVTETLEQQTASSEILRVIASSPTDVQPVFDTIVKSSVKLCNGLFGALYRFDGELISLVAHHNLSPEGLAAIRRLFPMRADRETWVGRAVLDGAVVHVPDVTSEAEFKFVGVAEAIGYRSALAVPLLREGVPIGAIRISRAEPSPFSESQIALIKTFADQAVIAIENVRLFKELQARNAELTESLEQQTATAEILRVIASSPTDLQPVLEAVAENAARVCGATDSGIFRLEGERLRVMARRGSLRRPLAIGDTVPVSRDNVGGRVVCERRTIHVQDIRAAEAEFPETVSRMRQTGSELRTILATPLLREGTPLGVIFINRGPEVQPFSQKQIALLETFANQAVIAIENVRLFQELEARNRELTESLEQQTATAEILRVISSSPTDLQPVLDAVAENAGRVCGAVNTSIYRLEDQSLRLVARHGPLPRVLSIGDAVPLSRETVAGRVVADRRTIHVEDLLAVEAEYPASVSRMRRAGTVARTMLVTPLLREGTPLGVILINRGSEVRPFSAKQIALLETFANQAVIAIENVRLFRELQARNVELTEALDQQTATGEVLKLISRSTFDVQPALETLIESAVRLCGAEHGHIYRFDGELLQRAAGYGSTLEHVELRQRHPIRLWRGSIIARAAIDHRVVHVPDVLADPEFGEFESQRVLGVRTSLAVPLLREDVLIGALAIWRTEVRPFTDKQVGLVTTFADQAVIAIENVRLLQELQARNVELTEALEQQTATAQILRVIASSPTDLQPVMEAVAENAARVCGAVDSSIYRLEGEHMRLVARRGLLHRPRTIGDPFPVSRGFVSGRVILDGRTIHIEDITAAEAEFPDTASLQRQTGSPTRTMLATPLLREGVALGAIIISRGPEVLPFSAKQIALLETFANQAVIAIENVRLLTELQEKNRALTQAHAQVTESLEQQTATAEILRVIASSPTDLQPVMEAVAANAARVCGAMDSSIYSLEGEYLRLVARYGSRPGALAIGDTVPVSRDTVVGRVVGDRRTIHVEDIRAAATEFPTTASRTRPAGFPTRTVVATPLLRKGMPLGVIFIGRPEVHPFSAKQIALLETFANQAAIAIENVRLFNELRERTAELTRSVAQLTALGDVGRALSSTLDLDTVLQTIVTRASQLAGTDACSVFEYDEVTEAFHLRATNNLDEEVVALARRTPTRKGEGTLGRMAITRQPVQIPDIAVGDAYRGPLRDILLSTGIRALLAVPMLREDELMGGLTVNRKTPGAFAPEVIELLQTFATQSALAIQNARLFREIGDKSRQLEAASRHKSEFLANMSHELRTPLNAILGFNEMILGDIYGELSPELREPLTDIQNSGKHLLRLINNVLDLSKIEAGRMELAPADYAVQDVVERVRVSLFPLAAEKGLELVASVPEDLPLAYGDAGRITQCLTNLAGNALKFTRQGRVAISVELQGDRLVYRVTDTGIGIAMDKVDSLFTEFRQGDATVASEFGGTGLGLSISKKFVEMHGGRIWVGSEPGKGSVFSFEIPLCLAGGRMA